MNIIQPHTTITHKKLLVTIATSLFMLLACESPYHSSTYCIERLEYKEGGCKDTIQGQYMFTDGSYMYLGDEVVTECIDPIYALHVTKLDTLGKPMFDNATSKLFVSQQLYETLSKMWKEGLQVDLDTIDSDQYSWRPSTGQIIPYRKH